MRRYLLTPKQMEERRLKILKLVAEGMPASSIASRLGCRADVIYKVIKEAKPAEGEQ